MAEAVAQSKTSEIGRRGPLVFFQQWRNLSFLHFSIDPEKVSNYLPKGVEIDTFNGKAWVGLVAFRIEGSRPRWGTAIPGLSSFPELNVRTYVKREGFDPAIVFLSIDAAPWLACWMARTLYKVPYRKATLEAKRVASLVEYRSDRDDKPASTFIRAKVGEELPRAAPGTLEHFLTERYRFFTRHRGKLLTACVQHPQYRLRALNVEVYQSNHPQALGLPQAPYEHACFVDVVDAGFYKLEEVRG
jgi:uncharacterized protein YqjF (DUF2071 family)